MKSLRNSHRGQEQEKFKEQPSQVRAQEVSKDQPAQVGNRKCPRKSHHRSGSGSIQGKAITKIRNRKARNRHHMTRKR
jgi:hypothetical protein